MEYFNNLNDDIRALLIGAGGSALFWIILSLLRYMLSKFSDSFKYISNKVSAENIKREYVFRKYTSQNGLAFYPQGYFATFYEVFKYLLYSLLFISISFLIGGLNQIIFVIAVIGAIYYIIRGLIWLHHPEQWIKSSGLENWTRVQEIEDNYMGGASKDTLDMLKIVKENIEKINKK